jgi:hypothetical protein
MPAAGFIAGHLKGGCSQPHRGTQIYLSQIYLQAVVRHASRWLWEAAAALSDSMERGGGMPVDSHDGRGLGAVRDGDGIGAVGREVRVSGARVEQQPCKGGASQKWVVRLE